MNKKEFCEKRKSIAYYSGFNGLEIKGIEYGINDFIYCVSNCWYGGKKAEKYHKVGNAFNWELLESMIKYSDEAYLINLEAGTVEQMPLDFDFLKLEIEKIGKERRG